MANRFTRAARALFGRVEPLESQARAGEQPQDDVATYEKATITLGPRYNPDELVGRKGLAIYAKMRTDEQVKAVMNFKRDAITARGWSFKYDDYSALGEEERAKRCRIFGEILTRMRGSFVDAINLIATGRDYGLSLTEKIYSDVTIDGQTYIGISELRGRDPSTFEFYCDDYGTLQRVEQVVPFRRTPVDMSRMIHYVHSPEFDSFYGRSDLREAYRSWYAKDQLVKLWLLYLEKMAGGFVVANRTDESSITYGSSEYTSLQEVLRNLHSTAGIIPPKGVQIEVFWPATTDAYEKALVFFDLAIAKALLVPNLLGISHTGQTGAFSQSQTQLEAFFWTLNADAARLEACINDQLVKDLGDQNFDDGDYPKFCFKPASVEHIKWVVQQWMALVAGKAVIPTEEDEAYIRKLLEMPKRDEESTLLAEQMPMPPQLPGLEAPQDAQGKPQEEPEDEPEDDEEEEDSPAVQAIRADMAAIKALLADRGKPSSSQSVAKVVPHGPLRGCTEAQFSRAVQRVSFAVIESRQDRMAADLTGQVSAYTAKAVKKLLGTDEDLAKLIDDDPTDIAGVEMTGLQKGRLKDLYRRSLASAWSLGGSLARNEIERARGQRFVTMTDLRDKAADYFEANGFRMAGNVADGVRGLIQQELQNSVKFGRTPKDTREVIWDRLVSRGYTSREAVLDVEEDPAIVRALTDLWGVSERQTAAYLDTLSRTNLFEAMNEARYAEFTDPQLGDFVQALEYSAILDDRTTEICEALNGKVYAADSPEWDNIRPPNHYNCRSVLVPVTAVDGWDRRESPVPNVQPQAGFGGTLQ